MSRAPRHSSPLDEVTVILIEPSEPGNLGAVARAMMNMGVQRLRLVGGCDSQDPSCRALAGKAYPIVQKARRSQDWDSAVADVGILVGATSARERLLERPLVTVREAASSLAEHAGQSIGLVFGPERTGLTDWHLARCQILATIPAHPRHPVLNLAQAVMVFCYEFYLAMTAQPSQSQDEMAASQKEREGLFVQVEELLTRIGFLSVSNPEHIMSVVRNLARPDLSPRDIRIVRGVLSQIDWYLDSGHRLPPDHIRKK